jgi:hypothetical protein
MTCVCSPTYQWTNEWNCVLFSDEKKFNLDGPDGFASYLHDLRKEEVVFSKRQQGGGSVLVWFAFSLERKSNAAVFANGSLNAGSYKTLLGQYMVPIYNQINDLYDEKAVFQQDNAKPHTAHAVEDWLDARGVTVLN